MERSGAKKLGLGERIIKTRLFSQSGIRYFYISTHTCPLVKVFFEGRWQALKALIFHCLWAGLQRG